MIAKYRYHCIVIGVFVVLIYLVYYHSETYLVETHQTKVEGVEDKGTTSTTPQSKVTVTADRKLVILLTESRSGSTWLGTLFQFVEDLMYVFEPLDPRYTKAKLADTDTQVRVLANLCKCAFRGSVPSFGKASAGHNIKSSVAKYDLAANVGKGAVHAEEFCKEFDITLAKCIRLTDMSVLSKLSELGCTNFQVIHLIRDPRAVIRSRAVTFHELYSGNGKKQSPKVSLQDLDTEEISAAAGAMCNHHLHNIAVSQEPWIKDKYIRIRYEDLVYKTDATVFNLFRFIKRPISTDLTDYIAKSMHGNNTQSNYQVIKDSVAVAEKWRSLNKDWIRAIEQSCEELMDLLKYDKYTES